MTSHLRWTLVSLGLPLSWAFVLAPSAMAGQHCVICDGPSATYLCEAQNGPGVLIANGGQLLCITEMAKRGGHAKCAVIKAQTNQCEGLAPTALYPNMSDREFEAAISPPDAQPKAAQPSGRSPDHGTPQTHPSRGASQQPDTGFTPDAGQAADFENAGQPQPKTNAEKRPPKTVVEMADRAIQSSKKGVNDAGEAVGETAQSAGKVVSDAAKKTGDQIGKAGQAIGNGAKKAWKCMTSLFSDC